MKNKIGKRHPSGTVAGKPPAKSVPVPKPRTKIFGSMKGSVTYMGGIVSPIDVEWEAEKSPDNSSINDA